ncbi:hypothetical protein KZX37_07330 [Microbacterium sp. EYE_5]|uniref:hypothetical protein n=1 Tax=unclassified Microbacterium TaxID=2609290 RepID=UPI002004C25F|nr:MULTISPECIES: hypothetical protein [unclassified Microbacterium]MCK6081677.1 hypothetical protein [Microbacterium sp. EYE_382]MCK6086947.1 hypothetical protein [Microbacterium sp. EYE_384]MCK6123555.1 hypothetical protein [Microbacterium sp. EYE_80]MCK6126464.1 hypothetical protein [Microbacterium sp. EYE_79]MCK6142631.1 hypothetical protein [Microbacterium sp. EYE_39]
MTAAETTSPEWIVPELARRTLVRAQGVPDGLLDATHDSSLAGGVPVLVRGEARIVPLAQWSSGDVPADVDDLWHAVSAACLHRAGTWSLLDLDAERDDAIGSYTSALRRVGASRVRYWIYVGQAGVALVRAGGRTPDAPATLALHVVPEGWLFHRAPGERNDAPDLGWSLRDVVALSDHDRGFSL